MRPKNMIAYVRVSSVGNRDVDSERYQTESGQLEEIEAWGKDRDVRIVAGPEFVDRDVSGAKLERPGFAAALAEVEAGRADGIVVATLDRFSRQSAIDALKRVEEVVEKGGTIASVGGEVPVDPTTPAGEFQLTLFIALNRMNWREYDRRWKTAKRRAADRGAQNARAPLGYAHGDDGRLVPGPLAPLITEMYRLAATEGVHAARTYALDADVDAPAARWSMQNVRRTLARRVYLGEIVWNGGAVLSDAHEPLTDLATWTRAQTDPRWRRAPSSAYPLSSGPVRCETCSSDMVGGLDHGGGERYYRCASRGGRVKVADCDKPAYVKAEDLEQYVRALLVLEAETREMEPEAHPEILPDQRASGALDEAERELESAGIRRAEFAAANLDVSPEAWAARMAALDRAVDEAGERYEAALDAAGPRVVTPRSEEIAKADMADLAGFLEQFGMAARVTPGRAPIAERAELVAA